MRRFIGTAAIVLVATSCSGATVATTVQPSAPATTTTRVPSTSVTTTTQSPQVPPTTREAPAAPQSRFVRPTVGAIQSISPDGETLLTTDGQQICLQAVDNGATDCSPWRAEAPADRSVIFSDWAADGSRVVFFDRNEASVEFQAAVYSLDTRTGGITEVLASEGTLPLDVALDPLGGDIAFLGRLDRSEISLFAIGETGEPQLITAAFNGTIHWLPGGDAVIASARTGELAGVVRIGRATGAIEVIAEIDEEFDRPDVTMVSADGSKALIAYRVFVARNFFVPNVSFFGVVDLATGLVTPAKPESSSEFIGPLTAVLSPDGWSVAYVYWAGSDLDADPVVAVRAIPGGVEQPVESSVPVGEVDASQLEQLFNSFIDPVWTPGDRLIFASEDWALVIDR